MDFPVLRDELSKFIMGGIKGGMMEEDVPRITGLLNKLESSCEGYPLYYVLLASAQLLETSMDMAKSDFMRVYKA